MKDKVREGKQKQIKRKMEAWSYCQKFRRSLSERGGAALQWEVAARAAGSALRTYRQAWAGVWVMALEPSADAAWIEAQQARNADDAAAG